MPYTLAAAVTAELIIKKSRFLAWVGPCEGREQALAAVALAWQQHPGATHVCWALMAGGHSAAVDDGEPGGTAGRPMLEVLRHHDLEGVLALVVRYYGGTPLGAGGLARAYTDAVAQPLAKANKIQLRPFTDAKVSVPYALEGAVRRELEAFEAALLNVQHTGAVCFQLHLPAAKLASFMHKINELSHGKARWSQPSGDLTQNPGARPSPT
jgi:uncharacterized YigZ family protein